MIEAIAEFVMFSVEAIAIIIAITLVTYLIARAATAAYFISHFNFLTRIANQHGQSKHGPQV